MYPAMAVANYFLKISFDKNVGITHLKLQKLVFLAHALCLALYDHPLVVERIEAWKRGPVIRNLYQEFKIFGKQAINKYGMTSQRSSLKKNRWFSPSSHDSAPDLDEFKIFAPIVPDTDSRIAKHLDTIWDQYGKYDTAVLLDWLHEPGTPWQKTWSENTVEGQIWYNAIIIDDKVIKNYYKDLLEKQKNKK